MMESILQILVFSVLVSGCCSDSEPAISYSELSKSDAIPPSTTGSNVLVILSDDIGIDKTPSP